MRNAVEIMPAVIERVIDGLSLAETGVVVRAALAGATGESLAITPDIYEAVRGLVEKNLVEVRDSCVRYAGPTFIRATED